MWSRPQRHVERHESRVYGLCSNHCAVPTVYEHRVFCQCTGMLCILYIILSMDLKITQQNLQHNKLATATFDKMFNSNLDLIQEPYLGRQGQPCLFVETKQCFYKQLTRPRAIVRTSLDMSSWMVSEFTDRDIATVGIRVDNRVVYFASVYLDINYSVGDNLFEALLTHCQGRSIPLVVGMDSNAHSTLWGSEEANARGTALEDIILLHNLSLLNVGNKPTFVKSNCQTHIDITLANQAARDFLCGENWRVRDDIPSVSDHRAITFIMGQYQPLKLNYRTLKRVDWAAFQKLAMPRYSDLAQKYLCSVSREGQDTTEHHSSRSSLVGDLENLSADFERVTRESMDELGTLKSRSTKLWKTWWTESLEKQKLFLKSSFKHFKKGKISRDTYVF